MVHTVSQSLRLLRRAGPEAQDCHSFMDWLYKVHTDVWKRTTHIPNESKSKIETLIKQLLGMKSGVSDFSINHPAGRYNGCWLEMKAPGRTWSHVSDSQQEWLEEMGTAGFFPAVAYGYDHAVEIVTAYLRHPQPDLTRYRAGNAISAKRLRAGIELSSNAYQLEAP